MAGGGPSLTCFGDHFMIANHCSSPVDISRIKTPLNQFADFAQFTPAMVMKTSAVSRQRERHE